MPLSSPLHCPLGIVARLSVGRCIRSSLLRCLPSDDVRQFVLYDWRRHRKNNCMFFHPSCCTSDDGKGIKRHKDATAAPMMAKVTILAAGADETAASLKCLRAKT